MSQILSQDEVDALLRGVSAGAIETEKGTPADASGVRAYDLTSQDRIVRGRMPTLEIINERFARVFRVTLSAALRRVIDVSAVSVEPMKFGEFMKGVPVPTSIHIFRFDPLRGLAMLIVEAKLVFTLVDYFFGGYGQTHMKVEGRDFTAIEQRLIAKVVTMILADLEKAWRPVHAVQVEHVRSEINPQFAGIVVPSDVVIVSTFQLEMEASLGNLLVCLPYSTVEPIKEKLYAGFQSDQLEVDQRWLQRLREQVLGASVRVVAELGTGRIKIGDLLSLNVGDVLQLDRGVNDPLVMKVEGIPKFHGFSGLIRGNQAVQIGSPVSR